MPAHVKHFFCKYGESSDRGRYKNNGHCLRGTFARQGIYLLVNRVATMQLSGGWREKRGGGSWRLAKKKEGEKKIEESKDDLNLEEMRNRRCQIEEKQDKKIEKGRRKQCRG